MRVSRGPVAHVRYGVRQQSQLFAPGPALKPQGAPETNRAGYSALQGPPAWPCITVPYPIHYPAML